MKIVVRCYYVGDYAGDCIYAIVTLSDELRKLVSERRSLFEATRIAGGDRLVCLTFTDYNAVYVREVRPGISPELETIAEALDELRTSLVLIPEGDHRNRARIALDVLEDRAGVYDITAVEESLDSGEIVTLDDSFIPTPPDGERVECEVMHVGADGISWECFVRDTDVAIHTDTIPYERFA